MKIAIALYGSGEKGKTTTLNLLIDLIISEITGFPFELKSETELKIDRRISFDFHGQKVGICTWGDNENELKTNCEFFEKEKCTFIVTATRSKGVTCRIINDFCIENEFALQWISKTIVLENQIETNLVQAQELIKYI